MLAVLGFWATDFFRIPGEMYSMSTIPKTIDIHDALLKSGPMYQLLIWIGLWDVLITAPACKAMMDGEREVRYSFMTIKRSFLWVLIHNSQFVCTILFVAGRLRVDVVRT